MVFKKVGDNVPIQSVVDSDGSKQVCDICNKPLVIIAIKSDDDINLVCDCTNSDMESN